MFQILSNSLGGEHAKTFSLLRLTCLIEEWRRTTSALVVDRRKKTSCTLLIWSCPVTKDVWGSGSRISKKVASWLQVSCISFNKLAIGTGRKI
jgi:hypothetical protein